MITLFMASIWAETNTFSPLPTGLQAFEAEYLVHAGEQAHTLSPAHPAMIFRRRSAERGWRLVDSLHAYAKAGGKVPRQVYESFLARIVDDLRAALPVQMVFLPLHGALVVDGYDDGEGELIQHVRQIVGKDAIIGVQLDPHCHLSVAMLEGASIIVMEKEYPHTDFAERAEDLFRLMVASYEGLVHPLMRVFDCRMMGVYQTTRQPMRAFVDRLMSLERNNPSILSISVAHGFPWGDVADMGTKILVVTDADPQLAEQTAETLGRELFGLRHALRPDYLDIPTTLDQARQMLQLAGKPIVIAEVTDNAGGGAPGDATYLLRALLEADFRDTLYGTLYDPQAVNLTYEVGQGARLALRIGGKMSISSGMPLDVEAEVLWLGEARQTFGLGEQRLAIPMGRSALIQVQGVSILLTSLRNQVYGTDLFDNIGLDLLQKPFIVIKSSQHFYAAYAPIAHRVIYCAPPGALSMDFANLPYEQVNRQYFPFVDDPFAEG